MSDPKGVRAIFRRAEEARQQREEDRREAERQQAEAQQTAFRRDLAGLLGIREDEVTAFLIPNDPLSVRLGDAVIRPVAEQEEGGERRFHVNFTCPHCGKGPSGIIASLADLDELVEQFRQHNPQYDNCTQYVRRSPFYN